VLRTTWVRHSQSPHPQVPIPRGLPQGLYFRGVLWGVGVEPLYKILPQKTFYNVLWGSILTPNNPTDINNNTVSIRAIDRDFSPESRLQQSQRFQFVLLLLLSNLINEPNPKTKCYEWLSLEIRVRYSEGSLFQSSVTATLTLNPEKE